jgi:hypothetical protein
MAQARAEGTTDVLAEVQKAGTDTLISDCYSARPFSFASTFTSYDLAAAGLLKSRSYGILNNKYPSCFVGNELVAWLVQQSVAESREHAVELGRALIRDGTIHHVCDEHHFEDKYLFYRFLSDEPDEVLQKRQHISARDLDHGGVLAQHTLMSGWVDRVLGLEGETLYIYKTAFAVSPTATYLISKGECSVSECEQCHPGNYAFSLTLQSESGKSTKLSLSAASSVDQEAWLVALLNAGMRLVEDQPMEEDGQPSSLFELSAVALDSSDSASGGIPFTTFAGRVCLVVNVASS